MLRGVSTRGDDAAPDSFIGFDSVPDKVADGSVVRVRYRCSRPCRLAVEVVLSTLRKTDLVVFRRKWISGTPQTLWVRRVLLRLPPSVSHRRRRVHGSAADAQNVTLQAWLDDLKGGSEIGSAAGIHKVQRVVRLSLWPGSAPAGCPSWSAQLEWLTSNDRIHQCPYETGVHPQSLCRFLLIHYRYDGESRY